MNEILQQGRATTRGFLILGVLIAWTTFQAPTQPVHTARRIVDAVLFSEVWKNPQLDAKQRDPTAHLPKALQAPLTQYRHEFGKQPYDYELNKWKHQSLRSMPIGSVLSLGDEYLVNDSPLQQTSLSELYLGPLRAELAQLEVWVKSAGLGPQATLGQLQESLAVQIELPVVGQKVSARALMSAMFLALLILQLYQCSLLTTAGKLLQAEQVPALRSWLPFHHGAIGRVLSFAVLVVPTTLWILDQTALRWIRMESTPSVWSLLASVILLVTTAITLDRQKGFRRQLAEATPSLSFTKPRQAA